LWRAFYPASADRTASRVVPAPARNRLEAYVEDDAALDEIVARGFDPETVKRIICMVDRNEYKRRQAAPGVKITPRAFGRDRRLPLASRYRSGG